MRKSTHLVIHALDQPIRAAVVRLLTPGRQCARPSAGHKLKKRPPPPRALAAPAAVTASRRCPPRPHPSPHTCSCAATVILLGISLQGTRLRSREVLAGAGGAGTRCTRTLSASLYELSQLPLSVGSQRVNAWSLWDPVANALSTSLAAQQGSSPAVARIPTRLCNRLGRLLGWRTRLSAH